MTSQQPLREHEVGHFGELSQRPNPNGLVVLTVPDFDEMLPFLEERLGRKMTADEIRRHRHEAPAMAMTKEAAAKMVEARSKHPRRATKPDP